MIGAGAIEEAWSFYHQQLGGFAVLGAQRGAYARGEGLVRMFVNGAPPSSVVTPALAPTETAAFFNEWGLYLDRLGQLDAASICFRRSAELASKLGRPWLATIALQNLAELEVLAGRAPEARTSLLAAADLFARSGEPAKTRAEERFVRDSRREAFPHLIELGGTVLAYLSLFLAEIAREKGEHARTLGHLEVAREWAAQHGDRELLARVHLERARAALLANPPNIEAHAAGPLAEARRIALDSGYGTISIDLALVRAEIAIARGDHRRAIDEIAKARDGSDEGWHGARHPSVQYARGELRSRALEARLREPPKLGIPPRADVVIAYGYRDAQWAEEMHAACEGTGRRISHWHDRANETPPEGPRVVLLSRQAQILPIASFALVEIPLDEVLSHSASQRDVVRVISAFAKQRVSSFERN